MSIPSSPKYSIVGLPNRQLQIGKISGRDIGGWRKGEKLYLAPKGDGSKLQERKYHVYLRLDTRKYEGEQGKVKKNSIGNITSVREKPLSRINPQFRKRTGSLASNMSDEQSDNNLNTNGSTIKSASMSTLDVDRNSGCNSSTEGKPIYTLVLLL